MKTSLARLAPLLGALLLAACGSSSDPEPTVAVTGSVYAAPVDRASVVARDAAGVAVSAVAATAADGTFTVQVPESKLAGPLFLEAAGGTFTDEATEASTDGGPLLAYAAGPLAAGASLHLTPQSTIVARMVQHGATLTAANAAFQAAFGFTPDPVVKPANVPPTGATPVASELAAAQAAFRAGAFSQLAEDLAIPAASQFELFHELAHDAADGSLDGKDGATKLSVGTVELPVDVQNRFSAALMTWQANTTGNRTALKVDQIGAPPFALKALTASYAVEYVAGAMPAAVKKTLFQVRVTDRTTGQPVTDAALALMPKMHMSTKSHACPTDPVVEATGGLYDATIYYVMASYMMDTTKTPPEKVSMGIWELGVMVNGERAAFYPEVGAGSFPKLSGGANDQIYLAPASTSPPGTAGTATARTYQLFSEGLTLSGGTGTFGVLITTMDTMMTFPHIMDGVTLHKPAPFVLPPDGPGPTAAVDWVVAAVQVEMSSDGTSWQPATHLGDGHYWATNLAGLVAGTPAAIRVRLTVDGIVKAPATGTDTFATFTAIPVAAP